MRRSRTRTCRRFSDGSAGAASGYTLLWVVVAASLIGVLVQSLTAKLGLATGRDLASLCRERLPHYKVPRSVAFLDVLPRSSIGEILKRELKLR